jgi:hypothetical protein
MEAIDLSVEVSGFIRLLVELEEEVLNDGPSFPWYFVVVSK